MTQSIKDEIFSLYQKISWTPEELEHLKILIDSLSDVSAVRLLEGMQVTVAALERSNKQLERETEAAALRLKADIGLNLKTPME